MTKHDKKINIKPVIIFPYRGYENNEQMEWYFWWTVERCKEIDPTYVEINPNHKAACLLIE